MGARRNQELELRSRAVGCRLVTRLFGTCQSAASSQEFRFPVEAGRASGGGPRAGYPSALTLRPSGQSPRPSRKDLENRWGPLVPPGFESHPLRFWTGEVGRLRRFRAALSPRWRSADGGCAQLLSPGCPDLALDRESGRSKTIALSLRPMRQSFGLRVVSRWELQTGSVWVAKRVRRSAPASAAFFLRRHGIHLVQRSRLLNSRRATAIAADSASIGRWLAGWHVLCRQR